MKFFRFLSVLFSLLIIPQIALASQGDELKQAIDEYFFAMTVEWDQQDRSFAVAQEALLTQKINSMIKSGMDSSQLVEIFNSISGLDYKQIELEIKARKLESPEQIKGLLIEKMGSRYDQGASWVGAVLIGIGAILGLVLIISAITTITDCMGITDEPDYGNSTC